jgi:hypothetical protein
MLVQFERPGEEGSEIRHVSINPDSVAAVIDSERHAGVSVIRLTDGGSGILVKGSHNEIVAILSSHVGTVGE